MVHFVSGAESETAVRFFRGKFAADFIACARPALDVRLSRGQLWMYDYNDVVWR
jgi:hypothetical protein